MFRKIMGPIVNVALKPYFERNKVLNHQMDLAKEIYNKGDKEKALSMCEEMLKKDCGYKPALAWKVRIYDEINENNIEKTSSTNKK